MARNWTRRERARHAAAIRKWKPWKSSTGPRTMEGKKTIAQNALKSGLHTADMRELQRLIKQQASVLKQLEDIQKNSP